VGGWTQGKLELPGGLSWVTGGVKYLGVYLGDDQTMRKNWDVVIEMVEGKLKRWRWLFPQMSYRGRSLIINNLVAASLWHRVAVLEPPVGLLAKIQALMVDFFWNKKMHWVPQCVLYQTRDDGGQGLLHLESRKTAFRLQFIQKILYGQRNVWEAGTHFFFGKGRRFGVK